MLLVPCSLLDRRAQSFIALKIMPPRGFRNEAKRSEAEWRKTGGGGENFLWSQSKTRLLTVPLLYALCPMLIDDSFFYLGNATTNKNKKIRDDLYRPGLVVGCKTFYGCCRMSLPA